MSESKQIANFKLIKKCLICHDYSISISIKYLLYVSYQNRYYMWSSNGYINLLIVEQKD